MDSLLLYTGQQQSSSSDTIIAITGDAGGYLHTLRFTLPMQPGFGPDEASMDHDWTEIHARGHRVHDGRLVDLSIQRDTHRLATFGADGTLALFDLDMHLASGSHPAGEIARHHVPGASAGVNSFTTGKWRGRNQLMVATTAGGVQVLDTNVASMSGTDPYPSFATALDLGRRKSSDNLQRMGYITALDADPAHPNLIASGSVNGIIACWDIRRSEVPLATLDTAGGNVYGASPGLGSEIRNVNEYGFGAVTGVRVLGLSLDAGLTRDIPSVVASFAGGSVLLTDCTEQNVSSGGTTLIGGALIEGSGLGSCAVALDCGSMLTGAVQDLVVVSSEECLTYMRLPGRR